MDEESVDHRGVVTGVGKMKDSMPKHEVFRQQNGVREPDMFTSLTFGDSWQ